MTKVKREVKKTADVLPDGLDNVFRGVIEAGFAGSFKELAENANFIISSSAGESSPGDAVLLYNAAKKFLGEF